MGWQDAPLVEATSAGQPAWAAAPVVGAAPPATRTGLQHAEDQPPSALRRAASAYANYQGSIIEPAATVLSSMVAAPVAGLVGMGQGLKNFVSPGMSAGNRVEQVANALTYQPRTSAGQAVTRVVQYPFEKLAQAGDRAGDVANQPARPKQIDPISANYGLEPMQAPNRGMGPGEATLINTAIQTAPAALLRGRGKASTEAESTIRPKAPGAAAAEPAEVTRAKDYVARNTSLDWNSLSGAVRQRLTDIARDSDTLGKLDPASVERQARLESLSVPVKGTRGQITRDTAQLNNEGTLAATESGRDLKAVRDAQSPALIANLEVLKGKARGTGKTAGAAETPEQVGLSVQDAALRAKLRLSEENVSRLYKEAEAAGELQGSASTRPLARLIQETPDLQHLGWVETWLNKAGIVTDQTGAATKGMRLKAPLKELEDLRQAAVARAMNGGTEGYYAGKVIRAIDEATDGAGGNAYKAARAARKQQALEFEDQSAVARLVENKSRTDRATALEDTWRATVLDGSIEDLNRVKRSLLTGGDANTRTAGRRAWRDIRAQTIDHIINESTKSSAPLPDGSPPVSAAGMQKAINAIGQEKLDSIFGEGTTRQINNILKATKDVRTEPPRIHPGSSTLGNVVAFLERNLGRVPVLGDTAAGVVRAGVKIREMGRAGRETREAQRLPLDEATQETANALSTKRNVNAIRRAFPSFIPSQERSNK